jgi:hypothetical protein
VKGKTILIVGLGLFIVLIIKDPNAAAHVAKGAWGALDKFMAFFADLIA